MMDTQAFVNRVINLHAECLSRWTPEEVTIHQQGIFKRVEENHAFNFQLWNAEDRARRDDRGFEFVYRAKREIDHFNQQRNNRMEMIDESLFSALNPGPYTELSVNSEAPGMMIDRLSILALKSFHMKKQTDRQDVDEGHRQQCWEKFHVIERQRQQLSACLHELLDDVIHQKRTFCVYHQFKMYNDPTLNPELYSEKHS